MAGKCGHSAVTHGKSSTRLYNVWGGMVHRCHSQDTYVKGYWQRGIKVCDEWRNSFEAFYTWAIANGYDETAPESKCTLDRIDVNGDYCPENCRWVDRKVQANNRTNNHLLTHNGKTQNMKQWAEETGIKYNTLCNRILTLQWNIERALTTPTKTRRKRNAERCE